jgi:hypothetical protein
MLSKTLQEGLDDYRIGTKIRGFRLRKSACLPTQRAGHAGPLSSPVHSPDEGLFLRPIGPHSRRRHGKAHAKCREFGDTE